MSQEIRDTITAIMTIPERPHHTAPGYEHWFAEQVWEASKQQERKRCAEVSGPKCAEAIMAAAGVACCEQSDQAGPGWFALDNVEVRGCGDE